MSRAILISVASCACAIAACGSGGDVGSAATRPATAALADTPEAAALGFEDSLDRGVEYRFACLAGNRFATAGFVPIGPVTARTERTGASTWGVTLVDEQYGHQPLHRWKVPGSATAIACRENSGTASRSRPEQSRQRP